MLCVQGLVQKQDVAEPLCRPPNLTLTVVHSAREGPAPRAQVSSLPPVPLVRAARTSQGRWRTLLLHISSAVIAAVLVRVRVSPSW